MSFEKISLPKAQKALGNALGSGFGELYFEETRFEGLMYDRARLASNTLSSGSGVGARRVEGATCYSAYSDGISDGSVQEVISALGSNSQAARRNGARGGAAKSGLYAPASSPPMPERLALIARMDEEIRALDARITNVTINIATSEQEISILGPEGDALHDTRPMSRVVVDVTIDENGRRESGYAGTGGRTGLDEFLGGENWLGLGREALRIALVNVTARPCPAGEQMLLLGPGEPGVLFHEAVGHGLEGDANRRGSSAFRELMGKRIAAKGVRVIDDGTIAKARGSLHFDDEGNPSARNVLIEDGILVSYMQDNQNAALMGQVSTGNCRRQSYAHIPMPRMTNTFLDQGEDDPAALLADMGDGIYATGFGGGQVDTSSGKFVFNCNEAYRVEGGKIQYPVKGATLIGDGPSALTKIIGIGNDLAFDDGLGNCGKAGQWVPVTCGQPSVLMRGITIGGTEI